MKINFNNLDDLFKHLENTVNESLVPTAEIIRDLVKEYIQKNLYEAYTPQSYNRTYELINSISVNKISNNTYEIYYDVDKIFPYITTTFWNQHASISEYDRSEYLPYYIERGTSKADGSLFERKPLGAMQSIIDNKNKSHKKILQYIVLELKKQGIRAAIVG